MSVTPEDITGLVFSRLTAIKFDHTTNSGLHYWEFQCSCGKVKVIRKSSVKFGETQSCGCLGKERRLASNSLPQGEAGLNEVLDTYKRNSIKNSREFSLNKEQFTELTQQSCHYCKRLPFKANSRHCGDFVYNGIDRVDNSKGYVASNAVACCETCNRAKLQMTIDEFKEWIGLVYNNFYRGSDEKFT
jgi:hypothetical protein